VIYYPSGWQMPNVMLLAMIETGETGEFARTTERDAIVANDSLKRFVSVGREDYRFFGSDCDGYHRAALTAIRNVIFDKRLFC